jgi:hypothetical protein
MACCGTWHTYIRTIAKQDGSVVGPLPISGALTAVVGDLAALLGSLGSTLQVENRGVEWITHMRHGAGIFTNISPKNHPNVGKYTIHGAYGLLGSSLLNSTHFVI